MSAIKCFLLVNRQMNRTERRRQKKAAKASGSTQSSPQHLASIQNLLNRAVELHNTGNVEAAKKHYQQVLKIDPKQPIALHYLGLALHQLGQFKQAIKCFVRAIELTPKDHEIYRNIALTYQTLGDTQKAEDCLHQALDLNPNYALAYLNLGILYKNTQRVEQSEQSYRKAIALEPNDTAAYSNLGNLLMNLQRLDEAEDCFNKAISIDPNYALGHCNLGFLLTEIGCHKEAETSCRKAVSIDPTSAVAFNNLGLSLHKQLRMKEAIEAFEKALKLKPDELDAFTNLSAVQQDLGLLESAEKNLQSALSIQSDHARSLKHLAILQLLKGDFKNGFINYDFRLGAPTDTKARTTLPPKWKGEDLNGKCLALLAEQGIGDEILYSTFIAELLNKGASLLIECDERLIPIYKRSFLNVTVLAKDSPQNQKLRGPNVDYQIELGSLCKYLRTDFKDFPTPSAFLKADSKNSQILKDRYRKWSKGRPVIGISWRGGTKDSNFKKSIDIEKWLPILSNPNYAFLSLQYGEVTEELESIKQKTGIEILHDPEIDSLKDMDGFTSQVEAVDMVISASNVTVHVAGGLGKQTWLLLSFIPPLWYWHLDREDSLWYPRLKLFRQPKFFDWDSLIDSVAHELNQLDLPVA